MYLCVYVYLCVCNVYVTCMHCKYIYIRYMYMAKIYHMYHKYTICGFVTQKLSNRVCIWVCYGRCGIINIPKNCKVIIINYVYKF